MQSLALEFLRAPNAAGTLAAMTATVCADVQNRSRSERYQSHLDRVSRSFAFCIERLPEPMRERVGLAYLLCRAIDTVEDATWQDPRDQDRGFRDFEAFLVKRPEAARIREWSHAFPDGLPEGERTLLDDSELLIGDFHSLPEGDQRALRDPILSMVRGMRTFAADRSGGPLRLKTAFEVNKYCFFVAGVVGEALTSLARLHIPGFELRGSTLSDAYRFGLFLQKVNLLKDQAGDETEGRYLVPSRADMRASLARDAEGALRYVLSIPREAVGFRLFCSWSLFLGLASLPFIDEAWTTGEKRKISRTETQELMSVIETAVKDDSALEGYFEKAIEFGAIARAEPPLGSEAAAMDRGWLAGFRSLYVGRLNDDELVELVDSGSRKNSTT